VAKSLLSQDRKAAAARLPFGRSSPAKAAAPAGSRQYRAGWLQWAGLRSLLYNPKAQAYGVSREAAAGVSK